jgi:hypothetical protein
LGQTPFAGRKKIFRYIGFPGKVFICNFFAILSHKTERPHSIQRGQALFADICDINDHQVKTDHQTSKEYNVENGFFCSLQSKIKHKFATSLQIICIFALTGFIDDKDKL